MDLKSKGTIYATKQPAVDPRYLLFKTDMFSTEKGMMSFFCVFRPKIHVATLPTAKAQFCEAVQGSAGSVGSKRT